jgi:hypothetical protein
MTNCVSCETAFESDFNLVYCDTCVAVAREFWQHGVEVVNAEIGDINAEVVVDGWLYIKGDNDQMLFKAYLRLLEAIGMVNTPNTWEVSKDGVAYILKLHPVDTNKPGDHIVPKGKLLRDHKVLTQPLFIKRKPDQPVQVVELVKK